MKTSAVPQYKKVDYEIEDINLAARGRDKIELAREEMSSFVYLTEKIKPDLSDARIALCLPVTAQAAVFAEALAGLGATICWSGSREECDDEVAAGVVAGKGTREAPAGIELYAWRDQEEIDLFWATAETLLWQGGPTSLLDSSGEALAMLLAGRDLDISGKIPNNISAEMLAEIQDRRDLDYGCWAHSWRTLRGCLAPAQTEPPLALIDIDSGQTATRIGALYQARALASAVETMSQPGSQALVLGFGELGKACARELSARGISVLVTDPDPRQELEARALGYRQVGDPDFWIKSQSTAQAPADIPGIDLGAETLPKSPLAASIYFANLLLGIIAIEREDIEKTTHSLEATEQASATLILESLSDKNVAKRKAFDI